MAEMSTEPDPDAAPDPPTFDRECFAEMTTDGRLRIEEESRPDAWVTSTEYDDLRDWT